MITATTWVPRGCAAAFPTKYSVDEHELARISKLPKLRLDDANEGLDHANKQKDDGLTTEDESDDGSNGVQSKQSNGYGFIASDMLVSESNQYTQGSG